MPTDPITSFFKDVSEKYTISFWLLMMTVAWVAAVAGRLASEERVPIFQSRTGEVVLMEQVRKSDAEWRKQLTPEQYHVTRRKDTERAFTGAYHAHKAKGMYRCVCCGIDLYGSDTKFDSGTGWPSFWKPVDERNVRYESETSVFMRRTEVRCARCDAHLGHVFDDGPPPTGKRHCINSASLQFDPREGPSLPG